MNHQSSRAETIAGAYLQAHERIVALLRDRAGADLARPVPACPGWSVHDVVSHLLGVLEDSQSGRMSGVPSDEHTAAQVAARADIPTADLLERWSQLAPGFAAWAGEQGLWPAAIDTATHEQDLRGALGEPGARDAASTRLLAAVLLKGLRTSIPVRVRTESQELVVGPQELEPELALRTTDFEVLRWRLGRRSVAQMAAMDWSGDPAAVIAELHVFGPSAIDLDE